jgi:hypothetical protein
MESIQVRLDVLRRFERGLDPQPPETSRVPARVLGYGEITTVLAIDVEGLRGLAFKRLPIFHTQEEMATYGVAYEEYNRLLGEDVGPHLPACGQVSFCTDSGRPIFYIIQRQLADASMSHRAIHLHPHRDPGPHVGLARGSRARCLIACRWQRLGADCSPR